MVRHCSLFGLRGTGRKLRGPLCVPLLIVGDEAGRGVTDGSTSGVRSGGRIDEGQDAGGVGVTCGEED